MGKTIAIWGPAGSPGRTTLSINIAATLASYGKKVILIDLDTFGGVVSIYLGLDDQKSGLAAICYRADSRSFTPEDLLNIAIKVPIRGGLFYFLSGIAHHSRWPEINQPSLLRVIGSAKSAFDYVVMDLSFALDSVGQDTRGRLNYTLMGSGDFLVMVGRGDPIGICRFIRAWPEVPKAQNGRSLSIIPVINMVRHTAVGSRPTKQLREVICEYTSFQQVWQIDFDQKVCDALLLRGKTIVDCMQNSSVAMQIASIARVLQ
ncbi:MAG: AAA family ATPase [Tropheryma whipplei]|nr:AAA family ATPase [Tropheryma whipplei]